MEPRVVHGWIVDEAPDGAWGFPRDAVTATHMLSGVVLRWVDCSCQIPREMRVLLEHPASRARPISGEFDTKEEARAFIERVIADA